MLKILLVSKPLLCDDVFSTLWCIEVDGQLNTLSLVDSQRQVRLFLKIFESETFKILFS